jgi:hypothetical protein
LPANSSSPRKTPGLSESELSSWPRNGSSNFPQNLIIYYFLQYVSVSSDFFVMFIYT